MRVSLPAVRRRTDAPGGESAGLAVRYYCVVDGFTYENREVAEAHVRMQHRTEAYDSYLVRKTRTS